MSTPISRRRSAAPSTSAPAERAERRREKTASSRLRSDQVWQSLDRASVAVLGHVTHTGQPRTSGVVYKSFTRRLYVAVAPDSWKARQIAADHHVSMTVLVRRGGLLSLLFPIPPATITFHGTAVVHSPGAPEVRPALAKLKRLLPPESAQSSCLIEITPEGEFLTYGIGVSLMSMRHPAAARARVPVA
ncbi:pyridoxamine 5'-phosphate oxidase family protein [Actinocrinis sp.]|uniref:pyridoxamine 5'-phosphate oxidase family protein n=1 Tax=Actinocrinis sp. TaxID=1920516 RepID=UPI002D5983D8|nr:pyridoxamine 5'-phosphate oxidase family protein [Actinocrinis sp.]HZP51852.1 pyridoxamine 5'-phosphate oxidase family protein [Actinocrinis sp.]